jgi:hypothetical protein
MAGPGPQYYTFKREVPLDIHNDGQAPTLGFAPGKGYYAKTPGGAGSPSIAQAAASDPYSQLTGYQALTPTQIQQQAQGEISPIIQAITGQATSQAQQAAGQIRGITDDYANELGQINMAAPYQQGEGQQAAVDAALQQSLTGEGASLAGGLSDRLAQLQGTSGAPALEQAAGQLASQGRSNGTTELANGSAALSNLIANAAAGGGFGLKLPGIAKLSGIQALGQNSAAQQKAVNDATLQTESQLPSIIQNLTSNNEAGLANAVGARQKQQALNFDNEIKDATLGLNSKKVNAAISQGNAKVAQGNAKVAIAEQNANTAATRAAQSALHSDRTYQVDLAKLGLAKKSEQLKALTTEAKLKNGGFTPAQVQRYKGTAVTLADQAFKGFTDAKGAAHPKLTYQQAVLEGQKEGLPLSILLPALKQVGYVPPALAKKQQKIADGLFPSPLDALVNGGG